MSGRDLTSFRQSTPPPGSTASGPETQHEEAPQHRSDATDLIYHALQAERSIQTAIPGIFLDSIAIDNARYAGEGASFTVYRRQVPPQKKVGVRVEDGRGLSVIQVFQPIPSTVIAYKVPRIEFDDLGRPSETTKHAMRAAVMELYLTSNRTLLQHKNIVDFLGLAWGTNPFNAFHKTPVLVVEFSEHGSLSHLLRQQYLPVSTRRKLSLDICRGVRALHGCNVVHGDLKSENVLVFSDTAEPGFVAKVSDFGYSHVLEPGVPDISIGGTRPWQAPETRVRVPRDHAKATDIYSLSLLVWCVMAHGINVLDILEPNIPSSNKEDRYSAYEALKTSGQLHELIKPSQWYPRVIQTLLEREIRPKIPPKWDLLSSLSKMQTKLEDLHDKTDMWAVLDEAERTAFLVHTSDPSMFPNVLALLGTDGMLPEVTNAIARGVSLDPTQRDLALIIQGLGGMDDELPSGLYEIKAGPSEHDFQWGDWPKLQPWLQTYLSTITLRRREAEWTRSLIHPAQALNLAALYTNGYGLPCNYEMAFQWMHRAMHTGRHTPSAYWYRFLRALGIQLDDARTVVPMLGRMAILGSRTALEDMREIWPEKHLEVRQKLRDEYAGVGANFFHLTEMLGDNTLGKWQFTLRDIDSNLLLFEEIRDIAAYRVNKRGDRILHLAASCGFTAAIEKLMDKFTELGVNQLNDQEETPLLCACRAGHLDTALWLLDHGADPSLHARNGETPLHWSISFDEQEVSEMVPVLFKAGANAMMMTVSTVRYSVNFQSGFRPDRQAPGNAIAWATLCGRPDIVKLLLDHTENPNICRQDWPGVNSALEIGAAYHQAECLRLMIDAIQAYNAEVERHPPILVTPLIRQAIFQSDLFSMATFHGAQWRTQLRATLHILVPMSNRAANIQGYDGKGSNLLFMAVSLGLEEAVGYLLEEAWTDMSADPYFEEKRILGSALGAFKPSDVNQGCGPNGRTPLLEAVRLGRISLVRKLLTHGASATIAGRNPFTGEASTWTAMHILAQAGHEDDSALVQLIHSHGAPVDGHDAHDEHRKTTESPLLLAIQNDRFTLAEQLVELGADTSATTLNCALLTLLYPTTILGHVVVLNARNCIARIRFLLAREPFASRRTPFVEPERQWTALHRCAAGHLDVRFRDTEFTQGVALQWRDMDWGANAEIMTELLFRDQAQLDAVDRAGNTALHLAVRAGNVNAVRLLLDRGARIDISDAEGEDAPLLALRLWAEMLSMLEDEQRLDPEQIARRECAGALSAGDKETTI